MVTTLGGLTGDILILLSVVILHHIASWAVLKIITRHVSRVLIEK